MTAVPPDGHSLISLNMAKAWLRKRIYEGGDRCPCCNQFAKVWKRQIHSIIARALIAVYNAEPAGTFLHLATVAGPACEGGKTRYWGLMEQESDTFPNGRSGWWRLTPHGRAFVECRISVPQYALVYDSRCLGLDGPLVNIQDCLGSKFSYPELLAR
jgi:hypothetical protein